MKPEKNNNAGKTVTRVLKMGEEGYEIDQIARLTRLPIWKVSDILQREYVRKLNEKEV